MEMVRNSGFGCFFIIIENFISKFGRFGIRVYLRSSLVHVVLNDLGFDYLVGLQELSSRKVMNVLLDFV